MGEVFYLDNLDCLVQCVLEQGYELYGPRVNNETLVFGPIQDAAALPKGYSDEQEGGHYRLINNGDDSYFNYVVGQDTWKRFLFRNEELIFTSRVEEGQVIFKSAVAPVTKKAFLGIRSCELEAIHIQDKVFIDGDFKDIRYANHREDLLLIAVNCTRSAATCFCASLDTGPRVKNGFDLVITEVTETPMKYILEVGSERGQQLISGLGLKSAGKELVNQAADQISQAAQSQTRRLDKNKIKDLCYSNMGNDSFWQDISDRCLNCANCTQVCPTCFCSTVEDQTSLSGVEAKQVRYWDSCFNLEHSHLAGGSVRVSRSSRYRQWFTHKLATWQDQFDTLGCTGCGRCITWCPVGIDITEEARRLDEIDS